MLPKKEVKQAVRRRELLFPILILAFGSMALLVMMLFFLVRQFDDTAEVREERVVQQGFSWRIQQLDDVIVPMTDWDKAIEKVDHKLDMVFADNNYGNQLSSFYGFTHNFIVDGDGRLIYSSINGVHADFAKFQPFSKVAERLLVHIRKAEAARRPIALEPNRGIKTVTHPIQTNGLMKVGDQVFIATATLIQPDLGLILPMGPRAPVVISMAPVTPAMLGTFAGNYMVDDLRMVAPADVPADHARVILRDPDDQPVVALSWTPRRPGSALYEQLRVPLIAALCVVGVGIGTLVWRSANIVDQLLRNEARSNHLAYHDHLTGLPNRAFLFLRLSEMLAGIGTGQSLLGVACFDLDRFKQVNDSFGHLAGDVLIETVAARLRVLIAPITGGFAARLGGDEFVVLCPAPDVATVEAVVADCLAMIQQPIDTTFGRLDFGCSIGVAIIRRHNIEPSEALRLADVALYRSKAAGRARATIHDTATVDDDNRPLVIARAASLTVADAEISGMSA